MSRGKSPIDTAWLAEHYPRMTDINELIDDYEREFGWRPTKPAMYVRASNMGLRKEPVRGRTDGAERMVRWSKEPEMSAWMFEHDHGQRIDGLADEFEAEFGFRLNRAQVSRFRAMHGTQTRRSHGGGKRPVPVGTERGGKDGYVMVKVAEKPSVPLSKDNWKLKHVHVWEQAHGPLPSDHVVMFADGDIRNFDPANLVAVPRRVMGVMNSIGLEWHDAESLATAVAIAEIHIERTRLERERPRVCPCCGREYTNVGRPVVDSRVCPECGKAGRKPPNRRMRRYDHDEIRRLAESGLRNKDIAERVGCTQTTVSNVLGNLSERRRARRWGLTAPLETGDDA